MTGVTLSYCRRVCDCRVLDSLLLVILRNTRWSLSTSDNLSAMKLLKCERKSTKNRLLLTCKSWHFCVFCVQFANSVGSPQLQNLTVQVHLFVWHHYRLQCFMDCGILSHVVEVPVAKQFLLSKMVIEQQKCNRNFSKFPKAKASVPGESNKLVAEWLSDWVCNFSPRASSAMEGTTDTKFGTRVVYGIVTDHQ